MSPELVAAIISLLIAWFSITKIIVSKGIGRAVWLIGGALFFLSWLGNSFQYIGVTGWVVSGVVTLLLGLWQFWGSRSGAITYSAEVAAALKAGKTHEVAILDGLNSKNLFRSKKVLFPMIAVTVLIIALGIYWFAYRPSTIRKHCFDVASERSGINDSNWSYKAYNSNAQRNYIFMYETCMQSKGINP